MKYIILLEDSSADATTIHNLLSDFLDEYQYIFLHFADLYEGLHFILNHPVDLLLLDLEFTIENVTTTLLIDEIPPNIPILVVSHLAHYQKPLSLKMNVKGFLNKVNLSTSLVSYIMNILRLSPVADESKRTFLFPSPNSKHIPQTIPIKDIRYIEFRNRQIYTVYLTNGATKTVYSVSFRRICDLLTKQNVTALQPVTKNQIININYIKTVSKKNNGKIELSLINLPRIKFQVGKKHQKPFEIFFN